MKRKAVSGIMLTLLMLGILQLTFSIQSIGAEPTTWTVDDDGPADFSKIQDAINVASSGDTISVRKGRYYEHVVVNKSELTLIGEDRETAIIDGSGTGIVVRVLGIQAANISDFTVRNGTIGLDLWESSYAYLRNVSLESSSYNFRVWGYPLENFIHDIDSSNSANGKPVCYWVNQKNRKVPADAGCVALINSTDIVIRNLDLSNNWDGALLAGVQNSSIENTNFSNNKQALFLIFSKRNRILKNSFTGNGGGIILYGQSDANYVRENVITNNEDGVYVGRSFDNTISKNLISDSTATIGGSGIFLEGGSQNNTILENVVKNNTYGVNIIRSDNNCVYHNNFIDNEYQVKTEFPYRISTNVWDDGYPSGGNYWSDYAGQDLDDDALGDTPYVIDERNKDNYPLMKPWSSKPSNPVEATLGLIEIIKIWNLPKGVGNCLTSKLNNVIHMLDKAEENGATHKLIAFVNQVKALDGKKLATAQADYLIGEAQRIISLIKG